MAETATLNSLVAKPPQNRVVVAMSGGVDSLLWRQVEIRRL